MEHLAKRWKSKGSIRVLARHMDFVEPRRSGGMKSGRRDQELLGHEGGEAGEG